MLGKIIKIAVIVIIVLAVWKLAGGSADGVASLFETIATTIGEFLNAIASKVADFFGHFLGGASESGGDSTVK